MPSIGSSPSPLRRVKSEPVISTPTVSSPKIPAPLQRSHSLTPTDFKKQLSGVSSSPLTRFKVEESGEVLRSGLESSSPQHKQKIHKQMGDLPVHPLSQSKPKKSSITSEMLTEVRQKLKPVSQHPILNLDHTGGLDTTVSESARTLRLKTDGTVFDRDRLPGPEGTLEIVGHGSKDGTTIGGKTPQQLAKMLKDAGITQLAVLDLKSCYSTQFKEDLAAALDDAGITVGEIKSYEGQIAIGRKTGEVIQGDGLEEIQEHDGSLGWREAVGHLREAYALEKAGKYAEAIQSIIASNTEIDAIPHGGQDEAELALEGLELLNKICQTAISDNKLELAENACAAIKTCGWTGTSIRKNISDFYNKCLEKAPVIPSLPAFSSTDNVDTHLDKLASQDKLPIKNPKTLQQYLYNIISLAKSTENDQLGDDEPNIDFLKTLLSQVTSRDGFQPTTYQEALEANPTLLRLSRRNEISPNRVFGALLEQQYGINMDGLSSAIGKPNSRPGSGSFGDLSIDGSFSLTGRPDFARYTNETVKIRRGVQARRHITAWHTMRGSFEQFLKLSGGVNQGKLRTLFIGSQLNSRIKAEALAIAHGKTGGDKTSYIEQRLLLNDFETEFNKLNEGNMVKTVLFTMNSNPDNLWAGDSAVNSAINNVFQTVGEKLKQLPNEKDKLLEYAEELKASVPGTAGKQARVIANMRKLTGQVLERLANTKEPLAARKETYEFLQNFDVDLLATDQEFNEATLMRFIGDDPEQLCARAGVELNKLLQTDTDSLLLPQKQQHIQQLEAQFKILLQCD